MAIVGLSVGSFINVVVYRLPKQLLQTDNTLRLWSPASHCPTCKKICAGQICCP
nr:prepilin peptidase [Pantoea rodasii]